MKPTPLIAKEIRLLFPAYIAALLLAIVPTWLATPNHTPEFSFPLFFFGLGLAILAISSFGQEFNLKTFPLLLTQPSERTRVWRTKITILAGASFTVFFAWIVCFTANRSQSLFDPDMAALLPLGAIMALVIFAGGLCATLLVRQVAAAFCFTAFLPAMMMTVLDALGAPAWLEYAIFGAYSVAAFLFARRLFYQAQEVGWTGGMVTIGGWRSTGAERSAIRLRRPVAALFWKELQLQQIGLICIAALFILHLGVVALRKYDSRSLSSDVLNYLQIFCGLWVFVPLLIGSSSVAEERKLGMTQAHLTLPVSRPFQFAVKLFVTILIGGCLSGVLVWVAENRFMGSDNLSLLGWCALLSSISILCFYASTLTEGLVQAMAASLFTVAAFAGLLQLINGQWLLWTIFGRFGFVPWTLDLLNAITWPVLAIAVVALSYRNFKTVAISARLWCRNLATFAILVPSIAVFTAGLYNRAWEFLTPAETSHGPPVFDIGVRRPDLSTSTFLSIPGKQIGIELDLFTSEGRIWSENIGDFSMMPDEVDATRRTQWHITPGGHFLPGSNWVSAIRTAWEYVAVRDDGTLWVSKVPYVPTNAPSRDESQTLVQFGMDSNWLTAARWDAPYSMLLKKDGTLWLWGPPVEHLTNNPPIKHHDWPGLRTFQPRRVGSQSNWSKIIPMGGTLWAWDTDGRASEFYYIGRQPGAGEIEFETGMVAKRCPELDHLKLQSLAHWWDTGQYEYIVFLDEDGKLWRCWLTPTAKPDQIGTDHDWTSLAGEGTCIVLKADGSLWELEPNESLKRLSKFKDWLAVDWSSIMPLSLAADGSLWAWPVVQNDYPGRSAFADALATRSWELLLAPSRKPTRIGNLFDASSEADSKILTR